MPKENFGSTPCANRRILPACLQTMSSAAARDPNVMTSGGAWRGAQKKYISSGIAAAAEIEPSETYRQNVTTRTNKITEPRNASGQRTRNIPAAVATPLPPLNLSQMGKQWPARAASAAIIIQVAESC